MHARGLPSRWCLSLALCFLHPHPAPAASITITFDDIHVTPSQFIFDSIASNGFAVESDGRPPFFIIPGPTFCQPDCVNSGTQHLQMQFGTQFVRLRPLDGTLFTLRSFLVGERQVGATFSTQVTAIGYHADGTNVSAAFTLDRIYDGSGPLQDFQMVLLPDSFQHLRMVDFVPSEPRFGVSLDQVVVELEPSPPVPVPAVSRLLLPLLALLLASAGLCLMRGRPAV